MPILPLLLGVAEDSGHFSKLQRGRGERAVSHRSPYLPHEERRDRRPPVGLLKLPDLLDVAMVAIYSLYTLKLSSMELTPVS